MHLKEYDQKREEARTNFFKINKREDALDEVTFRMWKSELENLLPEFWQDMNRP
jgi:hypothetical protein